MHPYSRPGILFRNGSKVRRGTQDAGHWSDFSEDCWVWGARQGAMDIVAYDPEDDEYVAIDRLQ